jgi:hypothetical protein
LQFTDGGTARIVKGLEQDYLARPTKGAKGGDGNHALWTLGHITVIEGNLRDIVADEPNPVGDWWPLFGSGTQPSDDERVYPAFETVLSRFHEFRAYNLKLLDRIGESGLDARPLNVPQGFEEVMTSVGKTFLLIALHNMVHYGQVCDVRRVVGLKPLL